jgi:hypothetical protein
MTTLGDRLPAAPEGQQKALPAFVLLAVISLWAELLSPLWWLAGSAAGRLAAAVVILAVAGALVAWLPRPSWRSRSRSRRPRFPSGRPWAAWPRLCDRHGRQER